MGAGIVVGIITYIAFSEVFTELLVVIETFFGIVKWNFSLVAILILLVLILRMGVIVVIRLVLIINCWLVVYLIRLLSACSILFIVWFLSLIISAVMIHSCTHLKVLWVIIYVTTAIAFLSLRWFTICSLWLIANLIYQFVCELKHILPYHFHALILTLRCK